MPVLCHSDTPILARDEVEQRLAALPNWEASPSGTSISKSFVAKNFLAALAFFEKVGQVAEAEGHHPDLHLTGYRNVQVEVSTHAAGGITSFDFDLAKKLDDLEVEYSPKWLRQQQEKAESK